MIMNIVKPYKMILTEIDAIVNQLAGLKSRIRKIKERVIKAQDEVNVEKVKKQIDS